MSAPYRSGRQRALRAIVDHQVVPFSAAYRAPVERPTAAEPDSEQEPAADTTLQVVVDRLRGSGPPAHTVWLAPLDQPSTLDECSAASAHDPDRGSGTWVRSLTVPVGLIDRPYG